MSVFYYDTEDRLAMGNARRCGSLTELLETVEVVSLHVDGRPENQDLFGEKEFAAMRPRSFFMNMSRGFVVDTAALRRHIESGHIAGAAIDVFPFEPKRQGDPFESDLRGLPNVILTPARRRQHAGGAAGHRAVRGRQADRVRRRAARRRCRSTCRPSAPASSGRRTAWPTCTATSPVCWRP